MKISKKCLTLHLYRRDEVLAAMRWAIITRNVHEAIFWGLELFDSDMEQDALEMLEFTWITQIGFGSFSFLRQILSIYKSSELDRNSWINLLYSLTTLKIHDSTAYYLLIRGTTTGSDWIPRFSHKITYVTLIDALKDTLKRGKLLEAWLISRAIDTREQWSILENIASQQSRQEALAELRSSKLSLYEQLAAAFVLVTLDDKRWLAANEPLNKKDLPSEVKSSIDEWNAEESLRLRRVYKIRPEALLHLTQRSQQANTDSSEPDILDDLLQNLFDSSHWTNIIDGYLDDDGNWKSDLYQEMFYSTYFPFASCDIPDEWSLADREKSHGRGLGRSEESSLKRFLDTILQRSTRLGVWNYIKVENYKDTEWSKHYEELRETCSLSLEGLLPLKPVIKSFEIY